MTEKWKKLSAAAVVNRKKFQGMKKDRRDTGGCAQNVVETNTGSQSLGAESASQRHRTNAGEFRKVHFFFGRNDKCSLDFWSLANSNAIATIAGEGYSSSADISKAWDFEGTTKVQAIRAKEMDQMPR
ncbi:hypothetical protein Tco_0927833 [Tanacetum coccineum]